MIDKNQIKQYLQGRLQGLESIKKEREWTTAELGDIACCKQTLAFIDSLQEEPVSNDLEEAASQYPSIICQISPQWKSEVENVFKEGAKWQKERILNNATEREVKVDICGYPYIDFTELYDYDKDIPLAKEGDKVKLVIIEENKL